LGHPLSAFGNPQSAFNPHSAIRNPQCRMARMRASATLLLLLIALLASPACGPTVDLTKGLQVELLDTGWFDRGIVNGQTKLVPSATFTLKNVSDQKLVTIQVNALFRRVSEDEEWGSGFKTVVGSEGLAPGATTPPIAIRSELGYTGSDQSRQEMLQNSHFVDAKMELFAKYASTQWVKIGIYPIERKILTK